MSTDCRLFQ